MKPYTLTLAALLAAAPVFAQTPSDESVEKLMQLTQIDKMIEASNQVFVEREQQEWQKKLILPKHLPQQQQTKLKQEINDLIYKQLPALYLSPERKAKQYSIYANVYKKYFTQSEIDHMIAYYQHPLSQEIASKTPIITRETTQDGVLQNEELESKRHEILRQFVSKVETIVGKPQPVKKLNRKTKP